ncbi:MAG: nucleoside hydrolase [Gemmatimonadales bacterium]|nr:MAG: nucleoside hydrolase [Gemmatimonadales bacterium]
MRVIIDTDPGIDDVVTLALTAKSPELDLAAVTTTYGNSTLENCTRNARIVLELAGRPDIPVSPGSDRPLSRPLITAPETHGTSGVGYAQVPPAEPVTPQPEVLLELLSQQSAPVILITLGPLTNLARAVLRDAKLVKSKIRRHLGMFGNLRERGNTNRWADFNAWADPEAADTVLKAGLPTTMVGLDATRRFTLSRTEVERLARSQDPLVSWLAEALRFYVEFHRRQERLDGCVVNDVLTVGELLSPGLLRTKRVLLEVDLDEGEHRGHTKERDGGSPVDVAIDVDVPRMKTLLRRVFADL